MRTAYRAEIAAALATNHSRYLDASDPAVCARVEAQILAESAGHADAFRFEPSIAAQIASGALRPRTLPGNPEPRRIASSYGLLQILYVTACDYGFRDNPEALFVPAIGLKFGLAHLAALLEWAEGDRDRALAA